MRRLFFFVVLCAIVLRLQAVEVIVEDTKNGLRVMTSAIHIEIAKDPWKLSVRNAEGQLLLQEGEYCVGGNPPPPPATPLIYYLDQRVFAPMSYRVDRATRQKALGVQIADKDTFWLQKVVGWKKATQGVELACVSDETDDPEVLTMTVAIDFVTPQVFRISASLSNTEGVWAFSEAFQTDADEQFFGLGQHFDNANSRGFVRGMQPEYSPQSKSTHNKVHLLVPFYMSSKGYGIFVPMRRRGYFDMAASFADRSRFIFDNNRLEFYFFAANDPKEIMRSYMEMTGMPPLYPRWAFAPHQWRNVVNESELYDDMKEMRRHDLPGSVIWIDNPWQTDYNDFIFDRNRFPNIERLLEDMKAQGYKSALWSSEFVNYDSEDFAEALQDGHLIKLDGKDLPFIMPWSNGVGSPVDFYREETRSWWQKRIRRCMQMGISGWKLDYGEIEDGIIAFRPPYLPGVTVPFYSGDKRIIDVGSYRMHYHKAFADVIVDEFAGDGFLICRTGAYGDQVRAPMIWPGDLDNDFSFHKDGIVGGLPAAIAGGISCSLAGFPYYASDIGGFRKGTPTKEVLIRWTQFGAFSPVMQLGGGGNHRPWDMETFDQETLQIYRKYARLHTDLFPYIYTYVNIAHSTGLPIMRHLFLDYPQDREAQTSEFQYLFGDAFLVAPVYQEARERTLYLPKGEWIDYWSSKSYTGPAKITVAAPLDTLPLFVKKGSIIPMADPTIDTLAPATDPNLVTWEQRRDRMTVRIYPNSHSRFQVYDGTVLQAWHQPGQLQIKVESAPLARHYTWHICSYEATTKTVVANGENLQQCQNWDEFSKAAQGWYAIADSLYVKTAKSEQVEIFVKE